LILLSQMKGLLNISIDPHSKSAIDYLTEIFSRITLISYRTLLLGVAVVLFVFLARWYHRRVPGAFSMLLLTTFLGWAARLDSFGIPLVGPIPVCVLSIYRSLT
jgi:MFS superfamily sulfate permease-like transporter